MRIREFGGGCPTDSLATRRHSKVLSRGIVEEDVNSNSTSNPAVLNCRLARRTVSMPDSGIAR